MPETRVFIPDDFYRIRQWLGPRPGNYRVDPWYLKRGYNNKVQFWNADKKGWEFVKIGDKFIKSEEGVTRIINEKGGRA